MNQDEADFNDDLQRRFPEQDLPIVERPPFNGRRLGIQICLVALFATGLFVLLRAAVTGTTQAAKRMSSSGNLRQLGLAWHNYHDTVDSFPTNSFAPDGTPLLSWRVHILPYVEGDYLYRQFHLDEPWDSPQNRALLSQMPRIYANPREPLRIGFTHYRGFAHAGALLEPRYTVSVMLAGLIPLGVSLSEFRQGQSATVILVEAAEPVEWTKPEDLNGAEPWAFPPLGGQNTRVNVAQALYADGSVRSLPHPINVAEVRAATSFNREDRD